MLSNTVRLLLHATFVYTCVEGLIVNITYPNVVAYLIKDVMILGIYVSVLTEQRSSMGSLKRMMQGVLAFGAIMVFYLVMPTRVSFLGELVALKQRLFYLPLMYVGYAYTRTPEDFAWLIRLLAWTGIPTALFGVYLYFAGPSALQSIGGNYAAVFYTAAGSSGITVYRVPGSFTSPGQFALYLLVHAVIMTSVLFVPTAPKRMKILTGVTLTLCLAAMLVSGSRSPLLMYLLCLGFGLLYMGRLSTIGIAALVAYTAGTIAFMYFGAGVQDRVGSILSEENYERFRNTALGGSFLTHMLEEPLGRGLGVATIAARHFTDWSQLYFVESYVALLAVETGILGFGALVFLCWTIAINLIRDRAAVMRLPWAPVWLFSVVLLLEMIALFPSSSSIDSAPGNLYFWFLIGTTVRLADLAQESPRSAPGYEPAQAASYTYQAAMPGQ